MSIDNLCSTPFSAQGNNKPAAISCSALLCSTPFSPQGNNMNSRGWNPREASALPTALKGSNNANHRKQTLVQPLQGWPCWDPLFRRLHLRLFAFVPFGDVEMEMLFAYGRLVEPNARKGTNCSTGILPAFEGFVGKMPALQFGISVCLFALSCT